jgi:glycosyltransferase involved in cell wall biosynthesis
MRLSLHMLVLNGAQVLDRALRPLAGIVDEICFTDTGSTDGTPEMIAALAKTLRFNCQLVLLTPESHPGLYFIDEQATFKFKFPSTVEFTGLPQLSDWADARNRSLSLCKGDYVLRIDTDDEVLRPDNILPTLAFLDAHPQIDFVMCPYEIVHGDIIDHTVSQHFFWRNKLEHRFKYVLHEHIPGRNLNGENWIVTQTGLLFRDWRDSQGLGVRVPHRNFKVLLLEYERCMSAGLSVEGHISLTLADEGWSVDPEFALHLITSREFPQARGWAHYIRGECLRKLGRMTEALDAFMLAGTEGELRGMLQAGFMQYDLGTDDYKATLRTTLQRRLSAMSCLISMSDVQRALHLLQVRSSYVPIEKGRRFYDEPDKNGKDTLK